MVPTGAYAFAAPESTNSDWRSPTDPRSNAVVTATGTPLPPAAGVIVAAAPAAEVPMPVTPSSASTATSSAIRGPRARVIRASSVRLARTLPAARAPSNATFTFGDGCVPCAARSRSGRGQHRDARCRSRVRRIECVEDVLTGDRTRDDRQVVARVEQAAVLERDVGDVLAGEEAARVRAHQLVVAGRD